MTTLRVRGGEQPMVNAAGGPAGTVPGGGAPGCREVPLIVKDGAPGRRGVRFGATGDAETLPDRWIPASMRRRRAPGLPEVAEATVVRHFTRLSQRNMAVDTHFYPLGSCTMKYNPKVNDRAAALPGFARVHPYQPVAQLQGYLELLYEMERGLCEICGMDRFSLQPAAGAQGELVGLLMVRAYHAARGERRRTVLIPQSAHGTNPASARMAGYEVVEVPTDRRGRVDVAALTALATQHVAALMLTNPNTLGLFEDQIGKIADLVHGAGALLYYDGANLNALLGLARPGDMGFDVVHLNLHKTFSTPHGGGGPGAGPVGVKRMLEPFLPSPLVVHTPSGFCWEEDRPQSIGRVHAFHGNLGVVVRAYTYLKALGRDGLRRVSEHAVLNANYLYAKLRSAFAEPYHGTPMHEFVLGAVPQRGQGVGATDLAKRLLDYGVHAPTVHFPLLVDEALMIEPPETEAKETLDTFAAALLSIVREAAEQPEVVRSAPHTTPVGRLDEVKAARQLRLRWPPQP